MEYKKCLVNDCFNKNYCHGYCNKHYSNFYHCGDPLGKFKGDKEKLRQSFIEKKIWEKRRISHVCNVKDCNIKHYAKGYCRKHYAAFITRKGSTLKPCLVEGCKKFVRNKNIYCFPHKKRFEKGQTLDLSKKLYPTGERNGRWNGGVSEYPNHYLMKKNRIIKLQKSGGRCEVCKNRGILIHHKDEDKSNHSLENLIVLCHKCHVLIHSGRKNKTSKYLRLYGINLKDMSIKFGGSITRFYHMHNKNTLKDFLTSNLKQVK